MFERKLSALNHPTPNKININDTQEFRSLILWLEDQKIRHYKIEDRDGLRQINSNDWQKAFNKYLKDLACPISSNKSAEQFEWLLSFAVRLEYSDNVDKYNAVKTETKKQNVPTVISTNPLDNLDFYNSEFINGVNTLAKLLNVTPHTDHLLTLKAISKLIVTRLNPQVLQNPDLILVKGVSIPLEEAHLGYNVGDYIYNQAAKILRLLHIQDLRKLQTAINETIVAIQTITANPKTDTKLGKVGR